MQAQQHDLRSVPVVIGVVLAAALFTFVMSDATAASGRVPVALMSAIKRPAGRYETTITGESAESNGTWVIDFRAGRYRAFDDGAARVHGIAVFKRHDLTFHDKNGSCVGLPGTYRFKLAHRTLKFAKVHDSCIVRAGVLAHTFTKVG